MLVAVVIGVIVLAALAVWALRRRGSDEAHSVAGYQQRLERLEELRRRQVGSVRVVGGTAPRPGAPQPPVLDEDGRLAVSSSPPRRPFEETGPRPTRGDRPPPTPYRRRRDLSIARMSHRPRRLGAPIAAAVAVIILVTGLAIAGAHSRGHSAPPTTTANSPRSRTTTPVTRPPVTTVPKNFSPTSTSGNVATYSLPFSSYTLTFTATTGNCYIEVTNASGSVPYAQVLRAGATQQLTLTGSSKVVLGAPSYVTVQVDGTPVTFPNPLPAPLDLTLNAAAPAGAGPSTTTTT